METFIVKHYTGHDRPIIKGNGFDGLEIGKDREEAEDFIYLINELIQQNKDLKEGMQILSSDELQLSDAD